MVDIAAQGLHKYYGSSHVLKGITFEAYSGEKIGLLGKNGSGKTTLFKIITGEETYDSGSISKATGKRVEMLAQIPVFGETDTVDAILRSSFQELTNIYTEMKTIEGDVTPSVFVRYGRLMDEYERLGGYDMEVKLDKVCGGMNIDERMRKNVFSQLSGGEKTRVNIARILLRDCDILLLDEPTNHLDLSSLEWLEIFLCEFPGTIIVISHDRIFLDRTVTRIIEIDGGKANFYSGNYSFYAAEREQRFLTQAEQYKQQQRKITQLETAVKRQRVWAAMNPSNTGLAKRAIAMERRIEQMDKIDRPVTEKALTGKFDSGGYASKEIVSIDSVNKNYGSKAVLNDITLKICRNDRIALVGANGCGKTTLLKLIINEEQSDSGIIKVSVNAKPAYMSQIITFEHTNATILDTLRYSTGATEEKARSILAGFHFKAADVIKKIGSLSGGEKSRLKLCLMMQDSVNFLLLDEPTNHLDIATREWIESALEDFDGTILFVSHDRYFLNKFAERVWSMENGTITEYYCGFDEYLELTRPIAARKEKSPRKTSIIQANKQIPEDEPVTTEALIAEAEAELKKINTEIDADLQSTDYQKMKVLCEKKGCLEERINSLYSDWLKEFPG